MCVFWKKGKCIIITRDYHKQMTQAIVDKLDKSEIPVLLKTLDALTVIRLPIIQVKSKEKLSDSMDKDRQK